MGLSSKDMMELMQYINKRNGWNNLYDNHQDNRKTPKYVKFEMDTRDGDIWKVTFTQVCGGNGTDKNKAEFTFTSNDEGDFKENIYNWLNKEGY